MGQAPCLQKGGRKGQGSMFGSMGQAPCLHTLHFTSPLGGRTRSVRVGLFVVVIIESLGKQHSRSLGLKARRYPQVPSREATKVLTLAPPSAATK
jgi:hypothetical protein